MTPAELRAALKRVQTTHSGFARLMGVGARQVRRWASGASRVPHSVEIVLTVWAAGKITASDLLTVPPRFPRRGLRR